MENDLISTAIPSDGDIPQATSSDKGAEDLASGTPTILLVGKCNLRETGNAATLHRLRLHVETGGYRCLMIDPEDRDKQNPSIYLSAFIKRENIIGVVGLHIYRCSSVLLICKELKIPYMCYFGGTDINEDVNIQHKLEIMTKVVSDAKYLIAFTRDMKEIAHSFWPFIDKKLIKILPQTITVKPNKNFDCWSYIKKSDNLCDTNGHKLDSTSEEFNPETAEISSHKNCRNYPFNSGVIIENEIGLKKGKCSFNGKLKTDSYVFTNIPSSLRDCSTCSSFLSNISNEKHQEIPEEYFPLVVLIAGIRPVKDVLFVASVWSEWQQSHGGRGRLLIIGPSIDQSYAKHVIECAARLNGVLILDKVDPSDCHEIIRCANVLINTSLSEGMSAAILEAMALGTPVLARNISGNSALILHGINGLLFDTPDAFIEELQRLLQEPDLPKILATNAMEYLHKYHCSELERKYLLMYLHETLSINALQE